MMWAGWDPWVALAGDTLALARDTAALAKQNVPKNEARSPFCMNFLPRVLARCSLRRCYDSVNLLLGQQDPWGEIGI